MLQKKKEITIYGVEELSQLKGYAEKCGSHSTIRKTPEPATEKPSQKKYIK